MYIATFAASSLAAFAIVFAITDSPNVRLNVEYAVSVFPYDIPDTVF